MYWGWKSRFHDLDEVMKFKPNMVEFHLTQEEIEKGKLNGEIYNCDYSIHLPEYWNQVLIDPCNLGNAKWNLSIYRKCIEKGLELRNHFEISEDYYMTILDPLNEISYAKYVKGSHKLKVIMHPGAMTIDPITSEIHPVKYYKESLYKRLKSFISYIEMIPRFKDNIEILIENMPPLPWFYGGQYYSNIFCEPEEIKYFCETTGRKFCLDISHLGLYCNYMNQDLIKAIRYLRPYVAQIHLADADGTDGEGASIGAGNIDFEKVMKEIREIKCAVIPENMWGHKENYKEFRRTMEVCNQWLI